MGKIWGAGQQSARPRTHLLGVVLAAVVGLVVAMSGCTVAPPVTGSATLPNGPGTISISQGPVGPTGFCLPSVFALSYVAQDTPSAFILTITASPSLCEKVNPIAAIYTMPKGATNLSNAWPQTLATTTPFTIKGPGVTTVTFHKGCLPGQFDVVTGQTPSTIYPLGPTHGPMLFPFPWAAGSAGLWYGSTDCGGGGGGCGTYTPTNLAVTPSSVAPGGTITASGTGTPGTTITISFRQPPAAPVPSGATVKVPADGKWSVPATVPSSLAPGTWQVVAGVEGCEVAATADITITGNPSGPSVLPATTIASGSGGVSDPPAAVEASTATSNGTSTGTGLAFTGSSVRLPVMISVVLLVVGALMLLERRRRHS